MHSNENLGNKVNQVEEKVYAELAALSEDEQVEVIIFMYPWPCVFVTSYRLLKVSVIPRK